MAFSLRSFFGKDKPDDRQAGSSSMMSSPQAHQGGYPFQKGTQSGTYSTKDVFLGASTPANGHSAAYQGGSPFSPAISVPSAGLTVDDILPFLPPDVVKIGAVAPGQPLQVSNELLERVLRSGQAALPLFEIYRVCPAIFRSAISPHDTRMVALPHHKLGGLAAFAQKNPLQPAAGPAPAPSPAPVAAPAPLPAAQNPFVGGNPFHQAADPPAGAAGGETTLFHPSPFAPPAELPSLKPETPTPSTVQTGFAGFGAQQVPTTAPPSPGSERTGTPVPQSLAGNPFAPSPAVTSSTHPFGPIGLPGQSVPSFGSSIQEAMPPVPAFFGAPSASVEPAAPASPPVSGPVSAPTPLFTFGSPSAPAPASPVKSPQEWNPGNNNPFFQSPVSTSGSSAAPPAATPAVNPFASFSQPAAAPTVPTAPEPAQPAEVPNSVAPWQAMALGSAPAGEKAGMYPEAPPALASPNPFERIKALSSLPEFPTQAAAAPQPAFGPPPAAPAEKATFSLATVLSRCSEQEIGVKPEQIPSWISVSFPVATLVDQLSSGKVTVGLAEIMRGLEPEFRSIITPSRPDIMVELPINDVFHALPAPAIPKAAAVPAEAALPAPAPIPAAPKSADVLGSEALAAIADFKAAAPANSPESQAALPSLFALARPEESTANLPAGVPWPFEVAPTQADSAPGTPTTTTFFGPAGAVEDPPAVTPPFHHFPKPESELGLAPEPPPLFQATSTLLGLPVEPVSPHRAIRSEAITFGPGVKAVSHATAPIKSSRDRNKQLLLRVLLSTEDDMELDDVIRLTGALPGVSAAVCLNQGTIVGSATNGSSEAENFVRQATQIYSHLQPLIQLTGIMDTETMSMKSDQLMASFSLQGDLVLGVLHDPGKNEPTLRERITLIARELKTVVADAP